MTWQDRITELRRVRAGDLRPDPRNWRLHPDRQRDALQAALDAIGIADAVLARETPDGLVLVDGHLRAGLDPDAILPVLVLDLDEDEAGAVIATLDPLAALAESNGPALTNLLDTMRSDDRLAELAASVHGRVEAALDSIGEWESAGMPAYANTTDDEPYRVISVSIETAEAAADFERLLGVTLPPKAKYLHYPPGPVIPHSAQGWAGAEDE